MSDEAQDVAQDRVKIAFLVKSPPICGQDRVKTAFLVKSLASSLEISR